MTETEPHRLEESRGSGPSTIRRFIRWGIGILLFALVVIQFIPVARSNPPVESDVAAPDEVKAILRRSCYDCHSNETTWPWYSRLAPVSWLVAHDVKEGREHLNFSTWNRYDAGKQSELKHELWEEVEEGEMPLWFYIPLHTDAKLSPDDLEVLRSWADRSGHSRKGRRRSHDDDDD